MFCYQCGTQLEENSLFCHKCGAKMPDVDVDKVISDSMVTEQGHEESGFRDYINEHVRKTTEFDTAEALLNSKVPQKFLRRYFGAAIILLFILFIKEPSFECLFMLPILFALFVYPIGLLVDFIFSFRAKGGERKTSESIDTDELIDFLNLNLSYLSPYFGQWSYIQMVGYNIKGAMVAAVQNALMGARVGTEFGAKKSCFVEIHISPDHTNSDSGQTVYFFSTSMRLRLWPARYVCIVKTVPILQAAMEYYLEVYKSE